MHRKYKKRWYSLGVVVATLGVSACATRPASQPTQHTAQGFAAESQQMSLGTTEDHSKSNVPSAPLTTPLCGAALREQAQSGAAVYTQGLTSGSSCTQNACFQPLTGTYITQNGTNSVCR